MYNTNELLRLFPRKRVKAMDGMAVTAEVWDESHDYHRQLLRFHALLNHGWGIVTGLEVIASDPPDNAVYVLPGIATDPLGQTIILPEPRAFDLRSAEGLFHLIVTYTESRPQVAAGRRAEDAPLYIHAQYGLEAVAELPATPYVELARIWRREAAPITTARNSTRPRANEIDLRFRREIGFSEEERALIALSYIPGAETTGHDEGLNNLARSLRQGKGPHTWIDFHAPLDLDLARYTLLALVGRDAFQLSAEQMNALYVFLQGGGTIFYESCRRSVDSGDPAADASFLDMMASLGVRLQPLERAHPLLNDPHLFAEPPDGFEIRGAPRVAVADGVVFSTYDYGCLWRGERRGRLAARSEIRNALEWGTNLLTYAVARRQQTQK